MRVREQLGQGSPANQLSCPALAANHEAKMLTFARTNVRGKSVQQFTMNSYTPLCQ